ncbi:hypothetical protein A9G28_11235 [Gilliamella sp. Fer1-1]|uniref:restriction endonuclease subunit S n=1 Tax=unclassified Gilliamella TaxID=2685620 RepID=UPI00080DF05A|nr:restriction endonuclease subunit S [Gilliamella apicola]OCG45875.1 hypothetical protein A9G28_11235 [Gilliamella apicola]OCG56296.1 hypothetical protein A9G30_02685 [Gilliamella apicola]OCG57639.1 hypothetical protein A9G40_11950 [Gilliamella apicola]
MSQSKKLIPKRRFKAFEDREAWSLLKQLNEYAEILTGGTPSTQIKDFWMPKEVPWMSSGEINKKRIFSTDNMISQKGFDSSSARWIKEKSILIALAGQGKTRGKVAINELQITTNQSIAAVVPNEKLDSEFLFQNLGMRYEELRSISSGDGSRGGLNKKIISELHATIPNIDEQKIIGIFFQKLDNLINTQQKKLEKAKTLKSAYLREMFPNEGELKPRLRFSVFCEDWTPNKLGDVTIWSKGANLAKDVLNNEDNGHPVIHYADLYKFSPVIDNVIHWSKSNEGHIIPKNSLLFPMSDVTPRGLARTTTITKKNVRAGSDTLIATISDEISAEYLSYQINANHKKIFPLVTGTTVKHINASSLSTLFITLTDIIEQNKISTFFNLLEKHINLEQKKLDKLKHIKQAYLNEMFV